ncbi:MAG: hypothetical protein CMJ75_20050 [Planctomycetaceae bacterium]|nr:hypothetical protein [Planctomycetaceae bacterium]
MRRLNWLRCLWPGLTRLGSRGEWLALSSALVFAGLLQVAVTVTFFWPAAVNPRSVQIIWLVLAAVWITGLWSGYDDLAVATRRFSDERLQDLFIRAQGEYLRGNWWTAQTLLEQLLALDRADVEAQLMLAALYRHTERPEAARRRLRFLERLAGADVWRLEIEKERLLLERLDAESDERPAEQGNAVNGDSAVESPDGVQMRAA